MKLSVSAYTAQASAHKNLCSYQQQRSYGATNQASTARTPSDLATVLPALKVRMSLIFILLINASRDDFKQFCQRIILNFPFMIKISSIVSNDFVLRFYLYFFSISS